MKFQRMIRQAVILACIALPPGQLAWAQNGTGGDHWVATWAASPQQPRAVPAPPAGQPAAGPSVATTAPARPGQRFNNQTVRMIVRTSIGGRRVRVQLSNAFGSAALVVGAAHVAARAKESEIIPASDRALTFSGKSSITIPAGASVVSDPVELDVPALGDLAVSVFFPGDTGRAHHPLNRPPHHLYLEGRELHSPARAGRCGHHDILVFPFERRCSGPGGDGADCRLRRLDHGWRDLNHGHRS